jgi:acyl-CoA dehydrogenase
MPGVIEFMMLLAAGWFLLAQRAPGHVWVVAVAAYLCGWTFLRDSNLGILILAWLIFIPASIAMVVPAVRRLLISKPLRSAFARVVPHMSATEREALEAGTVWWDRELFSGKPDWRRLLATPTSRRSDAESAFVDGPVEELCGMIDDWQVTHELQDLPEEVWQFIKANGFFGMIIPKEYGGLEFSAQAHSDVVMKLASRSISMAVTVMVPNSLWPAKLLLHYGTEAQKRHYLPRLARGQDVPCFALTGPEAGSDASSIPDTGIVCRRRFDGQDDVLGIRLDWEKRYITLGPVATVLGLAFKLYDPDRLLGDRVDIGITLALIPTDTPGIEIGNRHFPLNLAFQNGPNRGHDVFIPMDWVIGGPARVGQGWTMLMECLADGRSISLPALATGAGKFASRATGAYAAVRKQFKMPIGHFEGVAEALTRIAGNAYLMDAVRELTCTALDTGERPSVISAIAKYHLTERMRGVVNDAMDIQGGSGICLGPSNYLGRVYQAVPISITVEGANILTRSLIIFGQGAMRCHPYIFTEMQSALDSDENRGVREFDRALFSHVRMVLANASRAFFHALTAGRFIAAPVRDASAPYYRALTHMSAAFAFAADVTMLMLGGALKRKERLSARLGDTLSHLYLGSAVLKRYHDQGCPEADEPLMRWASETCLYEIQESLYGLLDNFPNPLVGRAIRGLLFPWGRRFRGPDDQLGEKVARIVLEPGDTRDRLTAGLYLPEDLSEPVGRLEDAFLKVSLAEPVLTKIRAAMKNGQLDRGDPEAAYDAAMQAGIVSREEANQVRAAVTARRDVIQVDAFMPDALSKETRSWNSSPLSHGVAGQSL